MPEKRTLERARKAKRAGEAPTTEVAESVGDEIRYVRRVKHGPRSTKQATAIGRDVAASLAEERDRTDETQQEGKDRERLLSRARQATDENRETDRRHTDDAIDYAMSLFSQEQEAHSRARSVVVTRDEFLAIVSHDLRAPLSAIALAAALVEESAPPKEPAERASPDRSRAGGGPRNCVRI